MRTNTKRLIIAAAVLMAALTIGSAGAYFTAQAQVPENIVKAGVVAVSTEPSASVMSIDKLAPGETRNSTLQVVNTGTLSSSYVVTASKKAGITDFWEALTCKVVYQGRELYSGPMATLKTAPFSLDPGQRGWVVFSTSLPATATNDVMGDYVKLTLNVDAEQVH